MTEAGYSVTAVPEPSYLQKIERAEKHLIDLDAAVGRFNDLHPYTVAKAVEGKKKKVVWRLEFTADPADTDIPLIAADAIYNLRSCLEHLMGALVPNKERTSAEFPIFFEGVWDAIVPGEDQQRIKSRLRWASVVKSLSPDAVAILKSLQPDDTGGDKSCLRIINRLSNKDRHRKLPVVASGLRNVTISGETPGAGPWEGRIEETFTGQMIADNQAVLSTIPDGAVNVKIEGTPAVSVRLAEGGIEIPRELRRAADHLREIAPRLEPFVLADAL